MSGTRDGRAPQEFAVILVAAGTATRMGFDKLWADVAGRPLLCLALGAVQRVGADEVVLVVAEDKIADAERLAPWARVVGGGARRRDSVLAGLRATDRLWLAVHDAARAFVPDALFRQGLETARAMGVAVPVVPLKDTVKEVEAGRVRATVDRSAHWAVQTPQVFRRDLLERALASSEDDVTDEATLLERQGVPVTTFLGAEENFKITTPFDFALAEWLAARRQATA